MFKPAFPSLGSFSHQIVATALENFAKRIKESSEQQKIQVVDATCGNGYDTCFLAQTLYNLIGENNWYIHAFDVQHEAIKNTEQKLAELEKKLNTKLLDKVTLLHQGHEQLEEHFANKKIADAIYNLGFLPRSDKKIITKAEQTLQSLQQMLTYLSIGGVVATHSYAGHFGGQDEMDKVNNFFCKLPIQSWQVAKYCICNKLKNPEVLFTAEKIKE